jgi:hypothetical protein
MSGPYSMLRRGFHLQGKARAVARGDLDPFEGQAILVGPPEAPPVVYLPIPKAANTSIRTAFKPCFDLEGEAIRNIHRDPRLRLTAIPAALEVAPADALVFTVVRHPAERIRSAWRNKMGWHDPKRPLGLKPRFGHARRLGIPRGASFEEFLSILAQSPSWAVDGHFKPQVELLHHALPDPRLEVFKAETIDRDWPALAERISALVPKGPDRMLDRLNASDPVSAPYTAAEKRLIDLIYGQDFARFGYSWDGLGTGA